MITKLLQKLKASRKRRELFVAGQIKTGIPFQIRALRDKKGWTQGELGNRLGMTQTNISRLESPGYGRLNITTLQRIAAAFDVGLIVRFVPFSELIGWVDKLSPEAVAPKSFDEEIEMLESRSTADLSDFEIVSSKVVQLPTRRMFLAGLSSATAAYIGTGTEADDWKQWTNAFVESAEEVYYIAPQPEFIVPDDSFSESAYMVKGGTTAELVM